jgi:hypothetical protein
VADEGDRNESDQVRGNRTVWSGRFDL